MYAGAGGLALGLAQCGFEPAIIFDADPDARATVEANTGWRVEPPPGDGDWRMLESQEISLVAGNLSSSGISVAGPRRD